MSGHTSFRSHRELDAGASGRRRLQGPWPLALILLVVLGITVVTLRTEGRRWWCRCGVPSPYTMGIHGSHTSQHLADPFTFTHVLHGMLFYGLGWLVAARWRWTSRLVAALGLECLWEVVENSAAIIGRYRRETVNLGYQGDSVFNSLGDIAACGLGFWLARRLPVRWSIALVVGIEAALLVLHRDSLLLEVAMLIHPIPAVKAWQMGH